MVTPPTILPGDCLAYRGTGLLAQLVRIKTWSDVSHVEVALNPHYVVTSQADGVKLYPYSQEHLFAVLRPTERLDFGKAMSWFATVIGQPYDAWSLLGFYGIRRNGPGMHCAETVTRWYRAALFQPFAENYPAERVSPGMFLSSPHFAQVWHV